MTVALALAASLLWGSSDFMGGAASRRRDPLTLITWTDGLVVVPLLVIALATGEFSLDAGLLGWGCGAGLVGLAGVLAFYRAFSLGAMGVVAPIAGLGVVVPVVVGIALGNHPDAAQIIGMLIGVAGVVLVAPRSGGSRADARVLALAAFAGASFGLCFVCIDRSEPHGTLMTLLVMRLAVLVVVALVYAARRQSLVLSSRDLGLVALIGLTDVGANACFARATAIGQLDVVSVLSSLYPAVTALLAWLVLKETLGRRQLAGVGAAMAAIVLLAAGPSA